MLAVGGHLLDHLALRIVRMATGFAGGVGDTQQEMCGALSAGVMIMGALHGRNSLEESDWQALDLATCYRQRFAAELDATRCGHLYERVHTPGGLGSCALVVERATLILLELLAGQRSER